MLDTLQKQLAGLAVSAFTLYLLGFLLWDRFRRND